MIQQPYRLTAGHAHAEYAIAEVAACMLHRHVPVLAHAKCHVIAVSMWVVWSHCTSQLLFKGRNNSHRLLYNHQSSHWLARPGVSGDHLAKLLDRIIYVLNAQSAPTHAHS